MANGRVCGALIAAMVLAPTLAFTQPTVAGATETPWIDTSDRAAVVAAFHSEFDRTEPATGYDGNAGTCSAGTTSQAFRDSVIQRVNWYRRMAGLGTVTERAAYTGAVQETSLMMSAQGDLDHHPDEGWACHTSIGAESAGKSNLALGVNGIGAINAYVQDAGDANLSAGHRRTMLYPQLLEVGTGDVDATEGHWAANTLHVFDDNLWADRPAVRESRDFVAWPPAGYVPAETAWGRWSFSLSRGDFSAATVEVRDPLGLISSNVIARIQPENPNDRIAPEPSIVWAIGDGTEAGLLPEPTSGDECYEVTIGGVTIGGAVQPDYRYDTCVLDIDFDPAAAPSSPTSNADSEPGAADCTGAAFDVWTAPCWSTSTDLGDFTDVVADWQQDAVGWLVENDVTTGVTATQFDPDASLTRGQAATLIWRLAGSPAPPSDAPTFVDVPAEEYYSDAVGWMARYGITTGTGGNRFSPHAPASRAEFVTFLWRLIDKPAAGGPLPFTDLDAVWQVPAVRWAAAADITTGITPNRFSPSTTVTRGQAAALLARFASTISS